jgi:GNAT superfamily N-acetyltransferase
VAQEPLVVELLLPGGEQAVEQFWSVQQHALATGFPEDPSACRSVFVGQLLHPRPGNEVLAWGAWLGGRPVGICAIGVASAGRPESAEVIHFVVHPDARRRGIARQLLSVAVRHLAGLGLRKVSAFTSGLREGTGPGDAFAGATGASCALRYRRLSLRVTGPGSATAPARRSPAGYQVLHWRDGVPPEHRAAFAVMSSHLAAAEAARSGSQQPESYGPEKIEALYVSLRAWGIRTYLTAARHTDTDQLVGYSVLGMTRSHQQHASQWDTIVLPSHRGHGLGAVLKSANLAWTRGHEVRLSTVSTWNAVDNAPMMSLNESLGFRSDAWGTLREWAV